MEKWIVPIWIIGSALIYLIDINYKNFQGDKSDLSQDAIYLMLAWPFVIVIIPLAFILWKICEFLKFIVLSPTNLYLYWKKKKC